MTAFASRAAALALALLLPAGAVRAAEPEKKAITIAVGSAILNYMPLALADSLGNFKKEGLDVTIQNFQATNFGTFYRSCGNCSTQQQRDVVIRNVTLTRPGGRVAGVNINYGDVARFSGVTVVNDPSRALVICQKYIGNNSGDEPDEAGVGADGTNCLYSSSDITYR